MKFSPMIIVPVALPLLLSSSLGVGAAAPAVAAPNGIAIEAFLKEFQPAFDAMTADPPPPFVDFGAIYVALFHP